MSIGGSGCWDLTDILRDLQEKRLVAVLRNFADAPPHHRIMSVAIHAAMQPSMPCIKKPGSGPDYESILHREVHRRLCAALHAIADKLEEPEGL